MSLTPRPSGYGVDAPVTLTIVNTYPSPPAGFPGAAESDRAIIVVRLPADADLWFQGTRMSLTGPERIFTTPALAQGQEYVYDVFARWYEAGREVRKRERIPVRAGQRHILELTATSGPRSSPMIIREFPRPPADASSKPEQPAAAPGGRMAIARFPGGVTRRYLGSMVVTDFDTALARATGAVSPAANEEPTRGAAIPAATIDTPPRGRVPRRSSVMELLAPATSPIPGDLHR
jgi:uncharacterized protein (TIGR03000 family)